MTRTTVVFVLAIALALCMPGAALADDADLRAGAVAGEQVQTAQTATSKQTSEASAKAGAATKAKAPKKAKFKKFKSAACGKITAKAAALKGAVGYRYVMATDRQFKHVVRDKTRESREATFSSLTGNKTYYGKVRAYSIVNGKKKWGPWSKVRSAKVKQALIAVVHLPGQHEGSTKRWIERGGAKAVSVTSKKADPAKYDGLIIPGGGDVDPAFYGQKRNPHDFGINRKLDLLRFALIKKFAKANKPVIGLCGGEQQINVCFGGTLHQHIPGWHTGYRSTKIAKGSWLYKMFGKTESTWHSHHQCVAKLGRDLVATQWDKKDGRIEAIEHTKYPVYGLQWHPEAMGQRGAQVARAFVNICSKYSTPRKK